MQNLSVKAGKLPAVIHIPPSKSYANRALILASINKKEIILKNMPQASDVTFLIAALQKIGLDIKTDGNQLAVVNHFPACEKETDVVIDVGEGGTTARFLAFLLLLGKRKYTLILGERLKLRPWQEFLRLAKNLDVFASLEDNLLVIQGPIKKIDSIKVDCSETTQFASGLKLALANTQTKIDPFNLSSSQSYFEMTQFMINEMESSNEFIVPMDWSSASYPMCFSALSHEIFFPGLKYDALQSDSKLYQILNELACINETNDGLTVSPIKKHKCFSLNVSDCLDLVPALGFLLSHIEGTHTITGIENLEHKESQRLEEVLSLVKKFGREAITDGEKFIITGKSSDLSPFQNLVFPNDHRMVMAGALFLRLHKGGTITPAEAVSKSYPDFFKLIQDSQS